MQVPGKVRNGGGLQGRAICVARKKCGLTHECIACLLACFVADFWGVRGGEVGVGVERERRIVMEDG